jgi:starvation-inducible outer membrane lipoprotein
MLFEDDKYLNNAPHSIFMNSRQIVGLVLLVCTLSFLLVGCAETAEPMQEEMEEEELTEPTEDEDMPPTSGRIVVKEKAAGR